MQKTKLRPTKTDAAAAVLFGLLFLFFAVFLNRGLNAALSDESYYFAMPYRFLQGDRMLVDEWYPSQFISFLLMPVVKIFLAVKGNTDGILLFFRVLFLFFLSAVYWIIYKYQRSRGAAGVVPLFLFCLSVPFTIFSFSYYSVSLYLFAVVCAAVFSRETPPSAPVSVLLGIVFSLVVFNEPGVVSVWVLAAVLTTIRQIRLRRGRSFLDRYAHFLNPRFIVFTMIGGAVCGGAALIYVVIKSGAADILRAMPFVLSDPQHTSMLKKLLKQLHPFQMFGAIPFIFCLVSLSGTVLYKALRRENTAVKTILFAGVCLSSVSAMAHMLYKSFAAAQNDRFMFLLSYAYLFNILGLELYCLCREKDPRAVPFLFAGLTFGFSVDLFSEATCGFGGTLILFYLSSALPQLLRELRDARGDTPARSGAAKKLPRFCGLAAAVVLSAGVLCWQIGYCTVFASPQYEQRPAAINGSAEAKADVKLSRGPLAGLHTSQLVSRKYNAVLDDMDVINAAYDGTIYIPSLAPYLYLYSNLRSGTLAAFFEGDYVYDRQLEYWKLLPEKRPDVIYVPNDWFSEAPIQNDLLAFIKSVCRFETEPLSAGYLFRVTDWLI